MTITFRSAILSDVDGIAAAHVNTWKIAYRSIIDKKILDNLSVSQKAQNWGKWLSGNTQALVALRENSIIGFISYCSNRDSSAVCENVAEISSLYVLPSEWNQNIGSQLCNIAFKKLTALGFDCVVLWVLEENQNARQFYEKIGFFLTGRKKIVNFLNSASLPEVQYQKNLIFQN